MSIRSSDTFQCFVEKNEDMIVQFTVSGRTITIVSGEVKFICIFAGDNRLTCMVKAFVQQFYPFRSVFI